MCQCLLYSKATQSYAYRHSFFYSVPYGLSQAIEYSSLYYILGPCCLSILYIIVCLCQSYTPSPSPPNRRAFLCLQHHWFRKYAGLVQTETWISCTWFLLSVQVGSHRLSIYEDWDPFRFRHMIPTEALQVRALASAGKL